MPAAWVTATIDLAGFSGVRPTTFRRRRGRECTAYDLNGGRSRRSLATRFCRARDRGEVYLLGDRGAMAMQLGSEDGSGRGRGPPWWSHLPRSGLLVADRSGQGRTGPCPWGPMCTTTFAISPATSSSLLLPPPSSSSLLPLRDVERADAQSRHGRRGVPQHRDHHATHMHGGVGVARLDLLLARASRLLVFGADHRDVAGAVDPTTHRRCRRVTLPRDIALFPGMPHPPTCSTLASDWVRTAPTRRSSLGAQGITFAETDHAAADGLPTSATRRGPTWR